MVVVQQVSSKADLEAFIRFPHVLNADDPCFIGEPKQQSRAFFNARKNPFYKHAQVKLFLAKRNDRTLGRIALIKNENYIAHHAENVGQFGFFDSVNELAVVQALFDEIKKESRLMGLNHLIGPTNFSFNDSIGTLVEGFTTPPFFEMPHNKPYYHYLMQQVGCEKFVDLLVYHIDSKSFPDRIMRAAPVLQKRFLQRGIQIRQFDCSQSDHDILGMRDLYNKAWVQNQGFVPVNQEEFQFFFKKYKPIIDPDLIFIAEKGEEVVGFLLALPNMNEVYAQFPNGKPSLLDKIFQVRPQKPATIRILAIGVDEKYRGMGIDSYLFTQLVAAALKKGYRSGEASRILETNEPMVNAMHKMDAILYKKYRLFNLQN